MPIEISKSQIQLAAQIIIHPTSTVSSLAGTIQNLSNDNIAGASLSAVDSVQTLASLFGKLEGLAPPLLVANLAKDGADMYDEYNDPTMNNKYSDATLASAASNVTAALTYLAAGD